MKKLLSSALFIALMMIPIGVWAGHPLETGDPTPVEKGRLEFEQSYNMLSSINEQEAATSITFGIANNLDLGFCGEYEWVSDEDTVIHPGFEFKWRVFGNDEDGPAAAITAGCIMRNRAEDLEAGNSNDYGVNFIYQHPVSIGTLLLNLSHNWSGEAGTPNNLGWGVALQHNISKQWDLVGEFTGIYNMSSVDELKRTFTELLIGAIFTDNVGFSYSAGVGYRPDDEESLWRFTLGITREF